VPLYEYQCDACGSRFEVIQKFSDSTVETCRECGKGPVHRLPSSPAIQFKGTGWYITDYAQKGQKGKSDASSTPAATSDTAKSDKSEGASDSTAGKSDAAKRTTDAAPSTSKASKE
jgi:putative FmdB family regulatory protein